ncbi:cyclic nucleotide-binding domain-containing protein [bacterium]|nr:cyclic nucleotide-binding domain-containing protein [bacterium]
MEDLKAYLIEHPFLQGLNQHHLDLIVGCAKNVRFDTGEFIFKEGQEANEFYLIRHGKVALEMYAAEKGHITIQTIGEGDVLGWSWLIPPYNWQFDARAVEITRAIALDGKCLRDKCEHDHDLGFELLKRFSNIVSQRLESTRLQLLDVYGN